MCKFSDTHVNRQMKYWLLTKFKLNPDYNEVMIWCGHREDLKMCLNFFIFIFFNSFAFSKGTSI